MKKLIYILIALTAFLVGVVVFYLRPKQTVVTPISVFELSQFSKLSQHYEFSQNHSQYKSLAIVVKGNLMVTKEQSTYSFGLYDYKNECSGDIFCYRTFELSKEAEEKNILLINELANKNESLGKAYLKQRVYLAEVEVTGYLEEREVSGIDMETVKIEEIKQISPIELVTVEEKPDTK